MSRESCVSGVLFIVTTAINIHSFSVMILVTWPAALHCTVAKCHRLHYQADSLSQRHWNIYGLQRLRIAIAYVRNLNHGNFEACIIYNDQNRNASCVWTLTV